MKPICSHCNRNCQPKSNPAIPTWFGKYLGDKLIEVICRSCYDKGVRYK